MNTIQGTFGWDNSPFVSAMAQAEQVATRGAMNIEQRFASVFKKSKAARGERAITNLLGDLTSGNIAQGLGEFAGRMTGLGIAASLGIGAAVVVFEKFREQIVATREAHAALEIEMTKHPISNIARLSDEGMGQALNTRQKLLEDAAKKAENTFGSEVAEAAKSALPFFFGKNEGKERTDQQKLENKASVEAKQIMEDRSKLAMSLVNIESARLQGYEREANISKIVLQAEQARAALQASGVTREAFAIGEESISRNAELQIKAEDDRAKMKERSLAIEEKMANLIKKGLTAEDQKKVRAGLELDSINAQLKDETSAPIRRQLMLQKTQKENELRGMGKAGPENPYQFGSLSGREWERAQESAKFNSQFASFGMSQEQLDKKGSGKPNSEVVAALEVVNTTIKDTMKEYWGEK